MKKNIALQIREKIQTLRGLNAINDPRVIDAKRIYENLLLSVDQELQEQRDSIEKEIEDLRKQVVHKKRIVKEIPNFLQEWLKLKTEEYTSDKREIVWYSLDLKFVILRNPGVLYWGGVGQSQNYAPSTYSLFDVTNPLGNVIFFIEGRLTKEKLEEIIHKIPEESRKGIKVK